MSLTKQKRCDLLNRLRRQVRYTAPVLVLWQAASRWAFRPMSKTYLQTINRLQVD